MTNIIKSDFDLRKVAAEYAQSIFEDAQIEAGAEFDPEALHHEMYEAAHEYADQSEHVIYTNRAIAICGSCDTSDGEYMLRDMYGDKPFSDCTDFDEVCTMLAYAVLRCAIQQEIDLLISEYDDAAE